MSNQTLNFLDIDLSCFVNSVGATGAASAAATTSNSLFSSNPNLSMSEYYVKPESPNQYEELTGKARFGRKTETTLEAATFLDEATAATTPQSHQLVTQQSLPLLAAQIPKSTARFASSSSSSSSSSFSSFSSNYSSESSPLSSSSSQKQPPHRISLPVSLPNSSKPGSRILAPGQFSVDFDTPTTPTTESPLPAVVKPKQPAKQSTYHQFNPLISFGSTLPLPPAAPPQPLINNSQISMMIPTATGILSRSNSQPDLTLNMEKPMPSPANYGNNGFYFNTNMPNTNASGAMISQYGTSAVTGAGYGTTSSNFYSNNPNYGHQMGKQSNKQQQQIRRHPSLSYKTSMSECNEQDDDFFANFNIIDYLNSTNPTGLLGATSTHATPGFDANTGLNMSSSSSSCSTATSGGVATVDDGLFLGTDALTDFLTNCGTMSDMFDDLPDLEDLMSLVTFESSSSASTASSSNWQPVVRHTQCDLNLPDSMPPSSNNTAAATFTGDCNPLSNYYDYCCNTESSSMINANAGSSSENGAETSERTTKSAPPSPTPQKKKQRPTAATLQLNKTWNKMDDDERSRAVEYLTRIINDEMGLREQLEIIRILNPDTKLKPTDTQFIIDLKIIDDDKFKRIKEVIKTYGLFLNEKQISDNSSDCSANSCPQSYQLAKRELRLKRAQQRLKLKQKKEQRQIVKESKSGLFSKTEVIPLSQVLPEEEDIDVDILS